MSAAARAALTLAVAGQASATATSTRLSEYDPACPKVQCLSELIEFTDVPLRLRLGPGGHGPDREYGAAIV